MRSSVIIALTGTMLAVSSPAEAQSRNYSIPAGRLDQAILRFGEQSGLSIAIVDPRLGRQRTRGIKGKYSPREALRRLLRGTGATYRFVNANTVRIIAAGPSQPQRSAAPRQPAAPPVAVPRPVEIVVTASKQNTLLDRYAGSVEIIEFDPDRNARNAHRGTAAIAARLPVLSSTSLGPGRDKLFIRGVADSSFAGPSQATVGQYLGDVRLTYNAPDPHLHLYDMERVEVLAGPQGTLYGTGALGGIIRLVPNSADPAAASGSASAGMGTTRKGGNSNDAAGMINLPIAADRLAVRAVGYRVIDAGYIDDLQRDLPDINRTRTYGGRFSALYRPGNGWAVEASAVMQSINSRDGQYALRAQPALTRRSFIAQPFDNDYRMANLGIAKQWQNIDLVSSTAVIKHDVDSKFDATPSTPGASPLLFDEGSEFRLLTHETRLSSRRSGGNDWVIGLTLLRAIERRHRELGDPDDPQLISSTRSRFTEAALFGQHAIALNPQLTANLGARLTYSRRTGISIDPPSPADLEPARTDVYFTPSLALSWRPRERSLLFLRYQEGRRAGGLTTGPASSPDPVQRFDSDTLKMIEAGLRIGTPGTDRLAFSATFSRAQWSDIQADLVDETGLPFTVNIGDGPIMGLDTRITWLPIAELELELSAFVNRSDLKDAAPAFVDAEEGDLPNVAELGARTAFTYRTRVSANASFTLDGSLRYVGTSQLGIGAPLDVTQGRYFEASMGARLGIGAFGISLDISNLTDVRGNRFAFGNPFGLTDRNQITPLRPRSFRIGLDARF